MQMKFSFIARNLVTQINRTRQKAVKGVYWYHKLCSECPNMEQTHAWRLCQWSFIVNYHNCRAKHDKVTELWFQFICSVNVCLDDEKV